jgi:restriction system protein
MDLIDRKPFELLPAAPLLGMGWVSALWAAVTGGAKPPAPRPWSASLFQQLTPQGFASICTELFAQPGMRTRVERIDAESTDLWLHPVGAMRPVAMVRCRQWTSHLAGVTELRELQGAMASRDVARGTFVTTAGFTADARRFARAQGLSLVDIRQLLALVAQRPPAQQCDLVAFAWTAR